MRKMSELLPIVRQHLMSASNPKGSEFICFASVGAYKAGKLAPEEDDVFREAVYARMDAQNPAGAPNGVLVQCLREMGESVATGGGVRSPAYWHRRDKWLDDWQADLNRTHICPAEPRHEGDLKGCGMEFQAVPDEEGLVDCPHCGMWHKPAK